MDRADCPIPQISSLIDRVRGFTTLVLHQLVEFVGSTKGKFSENLIQEVTRTVGINIFGELVSAPSESKLLEVFIVDVDVDED